MPKPQEREPIEGYMDDGSLDSLSTNLGDFSEGLLADIKGTIVGMKPIKGGEKKTNDKGEEWLTSDQLAVEIHVDNWQELDLEKDTTVQYINLPKLVERDGRIYRAKPTKTSDYAIWLAAFADCGVAEEEALAQVYQMKGGVKDLIGIQFHRETHEFKTFGDRVRRIDVCTAVYGWDNELRKKYKLPPITPKGS